MGKIGINGYQYLIRHKTEDGFSMSAYLLFQKGKTEKEIHEAPILLQIHGLLGHFLARGTPRLLPLALLDKGVSSMSINTRLAYAGQISGTGIFDDTDKDIEAAISFLNHHGFKNIFILGYSLGASMIVYWASKHHRKHKNVRGLILEGSHYSIPDSWKKDFGKWGSTPSYDEVFRMAGSVLGDDPYSSPNDETFVVYQSRGPNKEPINSEIFTYKTWWFMCGPEAHSAMAYKNIDKVNIPMLLIRGEGDFLVEDWEPGALAEIAQKAGNKHAHVVEIAGAKHDCMENSDVTLAHILDFFSEHSAKKR